MTITLTEERKQAMYALCQNILSNYQATIRKLAETTGVIMSSFRAVPHNQMYYRELENAKYSPWLDLVAVLTRKLTSQKKQQMN